MSLQPEAELVAQYLSNKRRKKKANTVELQTTDVYLYTSLLERVYHKMLIDNVHNHKQVSLTLKNEIRIVDSPFRFRCNNFKEICFALNANPEDIVRFIETENVYGYTESHQAPKEWRINYYENLNIKCQINGRWSQPPMDTCPILIDGYIHQIQSLISNIIPIEIHKICFDYYFLNEKYVLDFNKSWLYYKHGLSRIIDKLSDYHQCHQCNSLRTELWKSRQNRLITLECLNCMASRTVSKPNWIKKIPLR